MPSRILSTAVIGVLCIALLMPARGLSAAPRVVASIAPLHSLVAAVMAGVGAPDLLLRGGESPHTFSLRPSDARRLHDADVLFWIGPALELPLQRIVPNLGRARSVVLLEAPGVETLPARHLHGASDAVAGRPAAHGQSDRHGTPDPHIWLSPINAVAIGEHVAHVLAQLDPANAARYRLNAAGLRDRLLALDNDLRQRLADLPGGFAVFHDAYQYLEQRYGLHSVGTLTTHPERSPGAAHLQALRARLIEQHVRCLFSEPQYQPRLLAVVSEGLAIRHAVLDPLGADIPPGANAYELMMRAIADRLAECMRGGTAR